MNTPLISSEIIPTPTKAGLTSEIIQIIIIIIIIIMTDHIIAIHTEYCVFVDVFIEI